MSEDARKKVDVSPTRPSSGPCPRAACSVAPARSWSTSRTARSCASGRSTTTGSTTARASGPGRWSATAHVLEPALQVAPGAVHDRLQEAHLLPQPGQVPAQAGGLGSQRRAQPAEPWQEQVRAHLLGRGHRHHRRRDHAHPQEVRPAAILVQGDGHGESKTIHTPHGHSARLLDKMGGFTQQVRNPDSWEGWYWGAKHVWGQGFQGMMAPAATS